ECQNVPGRLTWIKVSSSECACSKSTIARRLCSTSGKTAASPSQLFQTHPAAGVVVQPPCKIELEQGQLDRPGWRTGQANDLVHRDRRRAKQPLDLVVQIRTIDR